MPSRRTAREARNQPVGISEVDALASLTATTLENYIVAVSAYVRQAASLLDGPKKAGQIRLSGALGRALHNELKTQLPQMGSVSLGETPVAGALRVADADLVESNDLDGLRLAVELKPVNLAVGRAIWNRFGDIRSFAVNIHLKFPFAVVGGVLAIPTYEIVGGRGQRASQRRSTTHLIARLCKRLLRAGGRRNEGDAPHLLEGVCVVAYDPDRAIVDPDLPQPGSGLRWPEFIESLVRAYDSRFISEVDLRREAAASQLVAEAGEEAELSSETEETEF